MPWSTENGLDLKHFLKKYFVAFFVEFQFVFLIITTTNNNLGNKDFGFKYAISKHWPYTMTNNAYPVHFNGAQIDPLSAFI